MPIHMRMPKRGFRGKEKEYQTISLHHLGEAIAKGLIDPKEEINEELLVSRGLLKKSKPYAKILGNGEAPERLSLYVSRATKSAIQKINSMGGTTTLYHHESYVEYRDLFDQSMKYEVSTIGKEHRTLCVSFSFSAEDLDVKDLENVQLVVSSDAFGLKNRLVSPGKDARHSGRATIAYNFNGPGKRPKHAVVDLRLMYRNQTLGRNRVQMNLT